MEEEAFAHWNGDTQKDLRLERSVSKSHLIVFDYVVVPFPPVFVGGLIKSVTVKRLSRRSAFHAREQRVCVCVCARGLVRVRLHADD